MNFANLDLNNLSKNELDNLIAKANEIKVKTEKVDTFMDNPMGNNYNWVVSNSLDIENVDLSELDNEELITLSNKVKTELKNKGLTTNGNTKGNTEKVDGRVGKSTRSLETDMKFPLSNLALTALVKEKGITNRMVSEVCNFSNPSNPNLNYWKKGVRKVPNKHTLSLLKLIFGNDVNVSEIDFEKINAKYA